MKAYLALVVALIVIAGGYFYLQPRLRFSPSDALTTGTSTATMNQAEELSSQAAPSGTNYPPCLPAGATLVPNERTTYVDDEVPMYYVQDGKVYFSWCGRETQELDADPKTFILLSPGIRRGPDVHPSGPIYGKDATSIFINEARLVGPDVATFTVLDFVGIAKDKDHFYIRDKFAGQAPTTLQTKWPVDTGGNAYSFGKTSAGDYQILAQMDGRTLILNTALGTIGTAPQVDPSTYKVLEGPYNYPLYSKDAHRVYCWGGMLGGVLSVLVDADPATFTVGGDSSRKTDAGDVSHRYYKCNLVN